MKKLSIAKNLQPKFKLGMDENGNDIRQLRAPAGFREIEIKISNTSEEAAIELQEDFINFIINNDLHIELIKEYTVFGNKDKTRKIGKEYLYFTINVKEDTLKKFNELYKNWKCDWTSENNRYMENLPKVEEEKEEVTQKVEEEKESNFATPAESISRMIVEFGIDFEATINEIETYFNVLSSADIEKICQGCPTPKLCTGCRMKTKCMEKPIKEQLKEEIINYSKNMIELIGILQDHWYKARLKNLTELNIYTGHYKKETIAKRESYQVYNYTVIYDFKELDKLNLEQLRITHRNTCNTFRYVMQCYNNDLKQLIKYNEHGYVPSLIESINKQVVYPKVNI